MKRIASSLVCAWVVSVLSSSPAVASASCAVIVSAPLHMRGHFVTLPVMIDGKGPFIFGIDTGAGAQARVSADVAKALALPVVGQVHARGLGPREVVESIVRMSMSIGSLRMDHVDAAVAQRAFPAGVQGILAFGFFKKYVLSLDFPNDRVEIQSGSITAGTPGAVAFRMPNGIPSVAGSVAGIPVAFDVDTGSGGYVGLDQSLASKVPFAAPPSTVGRACGLGGCVDVKGGKVKGDLVIAGIRLSGPQVDLLPLPLAGVGNLGYRFLQHFHIEFDQRSGYAVIEK